MFRQPARPFKYRPFGTATWSVVKKCYAHRNKGENTYFEYTACYGHKPSIFDAVPFLITDQNVLTAQCPVI
jgi:hypothetical protein